ncbi:MAG: hypothetical protein KJZ90_00965 [Rhodocyclaceae bacterium]|nr:hypothetical protein [Rhodocyclaceae bacterium]
MQLDIFADSRDVMLRNGIAEAFWAADFDLAGERTKALAVEFPGDWLLPPASVLQEVGGLIPQRVKTHAAAAALVERCDKEIARAAGMVLGPKGEEWMRHRVWARLADATVDLPFDSRWPTAFPADIWLRAGEFDLASASVERIPSWRSMPVPLRWKIMATVRAGGLDQAWPLIFELAWMAPEMLARTIAELGDPLLVGLVDVTERIFEGADGAMCWLPACALITEPALAGIAVGARTAKETDATRAYACVCALLSIERQGKQREMAEQRKRLRGLNEGVFREYMRSR